MPKTLENVLRVSGPFAGVHEKMDPDLLAPQHAARIQNVVLFRGRIEPRPGFSRIRQLPTVRTISPATFRQQRILQLFPIVKPGNVGFASNADLLVLSENRLFVITQMREDRVLTSISTGSAFADNPDEISRGGITQLLDRIYVGIGTARRPLVVVVGDEGSPGAQGTNWSAHLAGIKAPESVVSGRMERVPSEGNLASGVYNFAVSFYDKENDVESNATIGRVYRNVQLSENEVEVGFGADEGAFNSRLKIPPPAGRVVIDMDQPFLGIPDRVTHCRVYVRIYESDDDPNGVFKGAETTYRLGAEIPRDRWVTIPEVVDVHPEIVRLPISDHSILKVGVVLPIIDEVGVPIGGFNIVGEVLSDNQSGPFFPTRNGVPPHSSTVALYDNKVFYASVDADSFGQLLFSEVLNGEHVSEDDAITLPESGREMTTAMIVYQGRFVIFRESSIYILTGSIDRITNAVAAIALGTGTTPVNEPRFQVFRSESDVGCFNTGGVGVVECDGILYFNGPDGIYRFDGLRSLKMSDAVDSTFLSIPASSRRQCTMANDTRNGLLWIAYPPATPKRSEPIDTKVPFELDDFDGVLLCYDYRRESTYLPDGRTGHGAWTINNAGRLQCVASATPNEAEIVANTGVPVEEGNSPFSVDALVLAGIENDIVAEMLPGNRSDAEVLLSEPDENGDEVVLPGKGVKPIVWGYETPNIDIGVTERKKRFHYLTVDHGGDGRYAASANIDSDAIGTFNVFNSGDEIGKLAIRRRGFRGRFKFQSFFNASDNDDRTRAASEHPTISAFTIDAEPVGRR